MKALICCNTPMEMVDAPSHDNDTWMGICPDCDRVWVLEDYTGNPQEDEIRELIAEE
jgi:hypothetical protein